MSKKINVKKMDIATLSQYNVASREIIRLTAEKSAELKPLREKKAQILADRAKALEVEGAVLDDVLRQYSIDAIEQEIQKVNYKYAEPLRECAKAQNKVLKLINPNTFYAYAVSMDSQDSMFKATGTFTYTKSNGDVVTVKVGKNDVMFNCVKQLFDDLGALYTEDEKAMGKVVNFVCKRLGGLKFDRRTQDNVLKKSSEIFNGLAREVINYLVARGVVTVAEDGTLDKAVVENNEQ